MKIYQCSRPCADCIDVGLVGKPLVSFNMSIVQLFSPERTAEALFKKKYAKTSVTRRVCQGVFPSKFNGDRQNIFIMNPRSEFSLHLIRSDVLPFSFLPIISFKRQNSATNV